MFCFHGWVVVESTSGRRIFRPDGLYLPDDDMLHRHLDSLIGRLEIGAWVHFHHTVNGLHSLTVSGLRNHRDPRIFELFRWLAQHARRSHGFLFFQDPEDDDRKYDSSSQYRIYRLANGEFAEMEDLLTLPPALPLPPAESEGF